ncbi:hypothetical protein LSTR_LSTR004193 [Laodelphax striatellus]|uniref:Uncharacterized protein n=1 Tax=Laodelphax striatellus TaxID=195883 RepID=A0A482X8T5_LAOST|nr:hypothetical protein LSTR_LSTR004193 [Laodelphax striatellus]
MWLGDESRGERRCEEKKEERRWRVAVAVAAAADLFAIDEGGCLEGRRVAECARTQRKRLAGVSGGREGGGEDSPLSGLDTGCVKATRLAIGRARRPNRRASLTPPSRGEEAPSQWCHASRPGDIDNGT